MKKYLWIVILLSSLPFISIFVSADLPHTHDGIVHLARIASYNKALMDFHIPVRWAGELNYGYGLPLFNFIYGFPYLFSSVFLFLGFGLVASFKIVLFLSYLLSGIFMFLFGKVFFNDNKKALLLTVFYQFSPFRFVELMVRGSFGEVYTYTFLPLVLLGITLLSRKPGYWHVILTSIATALLIFSHNALSFTFFSVCVLFTFFFSKTKQSLIISLLSLILGVMLVSFYWMPAILEHKYTYGDLFMKDLYKTHFPPFYQFVTPNPLNIPSLQTGGVAVEIGLFHVVAILLSLWIIRKKNQELFTRKKILFCMILIAGALFFMSSVSSSLWGAVSFLRQFQFPWRFLGVIVFATSLLSVHYFFFKQLKNNSIFIILIILVVFYTVYYWNPPLGFDKTDETYYWNYPLNTTYFGETDIIWSQGPAKSYPKQRTELIGGKATITNFVKKNHFQSFDMNAKTYSQIVSHTQYFPGWRVYIDGKKQPIEYQDINWRGLITFYVEKGNHKVQLIFGESKIRLFADIISLLTLFVLIAVKVAPWYKVRHLKG